MEKKKKIKKIELNYKTVNLAGRIFGERKVLKFIGYKIYSKKHRAAFWLCKCSCGSENIVRHSDLIRNKANQCRSCATIKNNVARTGIRKPITDEVPQYFWYKITTHAKKRNLGIKITKKEAYAILKNQNFKCALSGIDINFANGSYDHCHGGATASLDRINSNKGYTLDNIQWVHKKINTMKMAHSDENFIKWCILVAKNNK